MDFPQFFFDLIGNRLFMAIIASIHVFINHPLAVGAYPLIVLIEWWGRRTGKVEWDRLAYRITFVLFIITTTVGALTGVGIWFTTALIAPFGIGSLLRVFFWAWFTEWLVFISEVILIMIYFLTWKRWSEGLMKKVHIGFGIFLAAFSWLTMAIIVGILGFMMDSGTWPVTRTFISGFFNPLYLPQLAFRTTYAMMTAGLCAWFMIFFFTEKGSPFRRQAVRLVAAWSFGWAVPFIPSALWYWYRVPDSMLANINVGLMTQRFMHWHHTLAVIMLATVGVISLITLIGIIRPRYITGLVLLVPFVLGIWLLGHFERVREFIRKPYVIADYMYSNGVKIEEMPVFQRDGILPYATWVKNHRVTSVNQLDAGCDVFLVTCSRCHTTSGLNSLTAKFKNLYGPEPWDKEVLNAFLRTMHVTRTYMPPFPGNDAEVEALVTYIKYLQNNREPIFDAQARWQPKPAQPVDSMSSP
ncbi:MAG: c-type cytochrome [candidate division Zixibacteria bacterium]|nr:c-type cytochrome [candidate division Zixibacteria bacterium]MDD5426209.1 c-type cytochrome [candidate division Zixibacteria bacterium]